MSELINENCSLLLLLEHLEIDFSVYDKTVAGLCKENSIDLSVFIVIGNLYNGFYPSKEEINSLNDISVIIKFLRNSHSYYKNDKYPEIQRYINKLHEKHNTEDIALIEKFFKDYFNEVMEHLDYEDKIAFPYFCRLIDSDASFNKSNFSVNEYREHHTDIETKLADLKNLLLKHIVIKNDLTIRRKFLYSLFELEFDLMIHSRIEEMILLPLVEKVEKGRING
jgi:regulator of cell morphogenesis and NO signaling